MYSYALLEPGCYYLVQEKEEDAVTLIKITVETDLCLYVTRYDDEQTLAWKRKTDPIHEILELLSDEKVKEWESIFNDHNSAYYEEEEDDD